MEKSKLKESAKNARIILSFPKLEHQLQAELQLPHVDAGFGAGDPAESERAQAVAGIPEVGVIQKIKSLEPKLQVLALGEIEVLLRGKIHAEDRSAGNHIASRIAERILRLERKGLCIEPAAGRRIAQIDVLAGDDIGTVVANARIGPIRAGEDLDRRAGRH